MAYMTYIERQGYAKGKAEGKAEGEVEGAVKALHESVARLLERKFGEAGKAIMPEIESITDADVLTTLVAEIGAAATLDDARNAIGATPDA